jgi:hypothetical protein
VSRLIARDCGLKQWSTQLLIKVAFGQLAQNGYSMWSLLGCCTRTLGLRRVLTKTQTSYWTCLFTSMRFWSLVVFPHRLFHNYILLGRGSGIRIPLANRNPHRGQGTGIGWLTCSLHINIKVVFLWPTQYEKLPLLSTIIRNLIG